MTLLRSMVSGVSGLCSVALLAGALFGFTPREECPVVSAIPQPNNGCVKAITGCICTTMGTVDSGSFPDCGGCWMEIDGSTDCTGGLSIPIADGCESACRDKCLPGLFCPCTQGTDYPFELTCGLCPH